MPTYRYACLECSKAQDAYRRIEERHDSPKCDRCYGPTELRITATMVSVFNPYVTVAGDRESGEKMVIRSKAEHSAFLRRNGYEEVGNDKSMAPRPPKPEKWQDAPDAPMVSVAELKKQGWIEEDLV